MRRMLKSGAAAAMMVVPTLAQASQGPGGGPGTAAPWLQTAMAILIYGGAALLVVAGLLGAVRQAR